MSHHRLAQKGPLTGQQLWQGISSVRAIVGLPETLEVPPRPTFAPSNVGPLVIENGEDAVRLDVTVTGELNEDIMVFGQEPCSRGRYKRLNVSYIGLLPPPIGGRNEVTYLYEAKFGEPRPGRKVFIVTCQQKDGWKGLAQETSATVPELPKALHAASEPVNSHLLPMYTGGTGDAQGIPWPPDSQFPGGGKAGEGGAKRGMPNTEGGTRHEAGPAGAG